MSTFGSFTTVRLGIYSAQKGLDVTGNNITNINTNGYTRQRLNQVSLIPSVTDRYASSYNTRIGQGAVIAGSRSCGTPVWIFPTARLSPMWGPPTPNWRGSTIWPPYWMKWAKAAWSRTTASFSVSSMIAGPHQPGHHQRRGHL